MESKAEQKRKAFKEQEAVYMRQITEMQKERAVLEEKLLHSEQKKDEIKAKLEQEIDGLKDQYENASGQVFKDREMLIYEHERMKNAFQEMEKQYGEVSSSYERDKLLWEGKFQFLEQQRDQAKSDNQESTRKFEMALEQLSKRGNAEKDKIETSQNMMMATIESKFKSQIKE